MISSKVREQSTLPRGDGGPPPSRRPFAVVGLLAALLLTLVAIAYHRAPENGFHFDDLVNIRENGAVRMDDLSLEGLRRAAMESPITRRKLSYVSFAVDWWRGRGEARAFQWTNVLLHGGAATVVLFLLLTVLGRRAGILDTAVIAAAFFGAGLWAVHPIQVQTVTYIVQRMALLAGLFSLLAVLFYLLARLSENRRSRIVMALLCGLALLGGALSKENAWITPVLLGLAEFGVVRRHGPVLRSRAERVLFAFLLTAAALIFAATLLEVGPLAQHFEAAYAKRDFTAVERVLTQPRVVLFHISQILWPAPDRFSLEHDFVVSTGLARPWTTVPALALAGAWTGLGFWFLRAPGTRMAGFFMLWIPTTLAIESSLVPLEMIFEHRMYLPSVGVAGLFASFLYFLLRRVRRPVLALGIPLAGLIVLLSGLTMVRVAVWRTPLSLAQDCVRSAPGSSRAWARLGQIQLREGDSRSAEAALRRSLTLDPDNRWALEFMAVILLDRGQLEEAADNLIRALTFDPGSSSLANHLGELLLEQSDFSGAEQQFRSAILAKPWISIYRWNRAVALEALGRCGEAQAVWNEYLALETDEHERQRVSEHLRRHYRAQDGKCYVPT